ncbi:MAG: sigma-70 family RNA polymerase sigma factor [Gemmataceae bacterium]|nr:sigma-70 family RNA polymerase sigma factor [Gemmataceae bacterium]
MSNADDQRCPVSDTSFSQFREQLAQGQGDAWEKLYCKYFGSLVRIASQRLNQRLNAKTDPETVAQTVMRTFFRRHRDGQFKDLDSWDKLFGLLVWIVKCKCANRRRTHQTQGRSVDMEQAGQEGLLPDREPTPHETAVMNETVDRWTASLDEIESQVLALSLGQKSVGEIAAEINMSERAVWRMLQRARQRLEETGE